VEYWSNGKTKMQAIPFTFKVFSTLQYSNTPTLQGEIITGHCPPKIIDCLGDALIGQRQ
jgi:hypothetical protein